MLANINVSYISVIKTPFFEKKMQSMKENFIKRGKIAKSLIII